MATMVMGWHCGEPECDQWFRDEHEAEEHNLTHLGIDLEKEVPVLPEVRIYEVEKWECDGENCQLTFDDQWSAQQCEAGHEAAAAEGRQESGWIASALGLNR